MKNKIRWLLVLPFALICSILILFPLHWILYLASISDGTIFFGFVSITHSNKMAIEYTLSPLFTSSAFIFSGYWIAPSRKFKTAIFLFCVYMVTFIIGIFIYLYKGTIQFSVRTILGLLGAVWALYLTRNEKLFRK